MLQLTVADALLIPLYFVLLSLGLTFINKRINKDKTLYRYFSRAFKLKLIFALFFGLYSIFLSQGDTAVYFTGGLHFKAIVLDKPHYLFASAQEFGSYYETLDLREENYGFVSAESNLMAMKFVALFSIFSFNNYMVTSMFFSVFSLFGLWYMFKTFQRIYPGLHKAIYVTFLLLPSLLFWGSGILKDTLCLGLLGIGFYNSYLFFFEKKYQVGIFLACLVSFYYLFVIKSYIGIVFLPCFFFWYFLQRISQLRNIMVKALAYSLPLIAILLFLAFADLSKFMPENTVEKLATDILNTQQSYIASTPDDGALLDYGEINPTFAGIMKIIPQALVASLYRPFIWEARKITSLFAAIEGTFLFCFTIYVFFRRGVLNNFRIIASDNSIIFTLTFSILFAIAIGLNCFNLGTLVRYKIPCMPFFILSLILILNRQQVKNVAPASAQKVEAV
ncbi:MAG: hypothetical protein EOP53_15720 [Sphingobacteriales bacterium]|nr:MAG: hypothetical protein EOP53_15720 [Sphingobacteriales bacterium]